MRVELSDTFRRAWRGQDPFAALERLDAAVIKAKDNRRVLRFHLEGNCYYAKIHDGTGWREIVKNLASLRIPVVSAENEWEGIRCLRALGVPTYEAEGFGVRGLDPARRRSFLITRELDQVMDLETLAQQWRQRAPGFAAKQTLLAKLAEIARTLHENGVNHRDFYLCHFLLDIHEGLDRALSAPRIFVVDLHRLQMRSGGAPFRWRVKDLGALLYSAMQVGLTQRDIYRFIRLYTGEPLGPALKRHRRLWLAVYRRARDFHVEGYGTTAPSLFPEHDGGR